LQKRPHSAAAFTAFSRSASQGVLRRRSDASDKEICYPPFVFSAARHGRFAEVESALLAGFVPNYADAYGNTIFHIACQNGRRRVAKLAVKYGCDMNAQNMKGHTGLHFLFAYGYSDIAEYFIKKGADERIANGSGKTAREGIK
jgi:ankyrin repeat protein